MKRLATPKFSAEETLNTCKSGIGNQNLLCRINAGIDELVQLAALYEDKASGGNLVTIIPLLTGIDENSVIAAEISKKEFITLYDYYLRDSQKPGRLIYDALLLAADDKCPFCGGIGRPKNLDHFMPKAFFPQFSIVPMNLVPACRDCNMDGKGQSYAQAADKQIIHPYLDEEHFFIEQWISANVIPEDPCSIEFFVNAPAHWNTIDKQRVATHFNDFELAKRYSVQAAEELSTLISQRRGFMNDFTSDDFRAYLSSFLDSPLFVNHWKKIMYQCLTLDSWFCSNSF